jgi:hypothetical protein
MELLQKAKTGVMVHICNPAALGRLRQEDWKFKASLGYSLRSSHKTKNKIK